MQSENVRHRQALCREDRQVDEGNTTKVERLG